MSLVLSDSSPKDLEAKTNGIGMGEYPPGTLFLGDYAIPLTDFLSLAYYVLTNTDLEPNDPRLQFVKSVRGMNTVKGYNKKAKRLETKVSPVTTTQETTC